MTKVALKIRSSGHCWAHAHHVMRGAPREEIQFFATWGELEHPREGTILFDTGYTSRFHDLTRGFPNSIYARMTAVEILQVDEAKSQVNPSDVKHVLLSHLHADHVGGVRDFPHAQCWTSAGCLSEFNALPRWRGFSKWLLHELMPFDWETKAKPFESCQSVEHPQLGTGWDLFEDGSIVMFAFPGHAAGQHGALIQTQDEGPVLLVADAIWNIKALTENRTPHPIVRLFFDDWRAYHASLSKLHAFRAAHPSVPILATHCPETHARVQRPLPA